MKRKLAATLILIVLFSATACQPTPEKGIVAQKGSERMIENAQKDGAGTGEAGSLSEQYGIPETYQFELAGAQGKLNVKVDARVVVPEGNAMAIYRVKAADFTQEQVDAFWAALVGGAEMWRTAERRTKSEIEQDIIYFKKFMKEEGEEDSPNALAYLAELERALETAPETIAEERAYGELETMYLYKDSMARTEKLGSYTGLSAYEKGGGRNFSVQNNNDMKEEYYEQDPDGKGGGGRPLRRLAMMSYSDNRNPAAQVNFGYSPAVPVLEDGDLDAALLKNIGLKPGEAKQMVQDLIDKTGADMTIDSIYYMDDEQKGYVDGEFRPAENYAYKVFCVRTVDGLPCSYIDMASEVSGEHMPISWHYEKIEFKVNAGGIFEVDWWSPLDIMETVNEDAQLKPFSEIREIFEKMMRIKYEADPSVSYGGGMDFQINRVVLSLQRIAEQNSFENGLLVPVWNFYGKKTVHNDDASSYEEFGMSFLSINAVDGSIIDTQKGY